MLRLENYGFTPGRITSFIVCSAVGIIITAAVGILLYCLFGTGLARIAKKRGEEKEWYAYLPLLRYYTLGKMVGGSEKIKKIFACLLPSLFAAKFILCVISAALLTRGAASLLFAAENIEGSAIDLTALVSFPIGYYIAALIITLIVSAAAKIVSAICYFGAFRDKGNTQAAVFTVLTFICCSLGGIFLYVASKGNSGENTADKESAEETKEGADE
ncbi:MAG: hypothetical protein J5659_05435 [Clostridia bacterium]|nr:hypothetical protein [Clostridia bacterium]